MDYTDIAVRKQIIDEILGAENKKRKEEHLKRYEIYRERQLAFVEDQLRQEFSSDTVNEMRKISSINLAKRIIDELASIYKTTPTRTFQTPAGELTEIQTQQCENLYQYSNANVKLKRANKWYELHQQCAIQTLPKNGIIDLRVLAPHQYDVIPKQDDPEKADCYVINTFDKSSYLAGLGTGNSSRAFNNPSRMAQGTYYSDGSNQKIGDPDDYRRSMQRYVWWSETYNFVTDGHGVIVANDQKVLTPNYEDYQHELGMLPFTDVAVDKDFEFWVRAGNGVTDFSIEFLTLLSDVFNIHKMQGFAQAIIYSEKPPSNVRIGPNHILHLPLDSNKEAQPRFEFANPNPDMQASLTLIENFLRMFLTSRGIDPRSVSGTAEAIKYSSGIERLLAMIEKFEASRDSFDLFTYVEKDIFNKMKGWSNLMQGANQPSETTEPLIQDLQLAAIPEDAFVTVNFASPEIIQTKAEREDSSIKSIEAGLMSRSEAIQFIRGVNEEAAMQILKRIDAEQIMLAEPEDEESEDEESEVDDAESEE